MWYLLLSHHGHKLLVSVFSIAALYHYLFSWNTYLGNRPCRPDPVVFLIAVRQLLPLRYVANSTVRNVCRICRRKGERQLMMITLTRSPSSKQLFYLNTSGLFYCLSVSRYFPSSLVHVTCFWFLNRIVPPSSLL